MASAVTILNSSASSCYAQAAGTLGVAEHHVKVLALSTASLALATANPLDAEDRVRYIFAASK